MLPSSSVQSVLQHEWKLMDSGIHSLRAVGKNPPNKTENSHKKNKTHLYKLSPVCTKSDIICLSRQNVNVSVFSLFSSRACQVQSAPGSPVSLNPVTMTGRSETITNAKKIKAPKRRNQGFNMPEQQRHTIRKMKVRLSPVCFQFKFSPIRLLPVCSRREKVLEHARQICVCLCVRVQVWSHRGNISTL